MGGAGGYGAGGSRSGRVDAMLPLLSSARADGIGQYCEICAVETGLGRNCRSRRVEYGLCLG